MNEQNVMDMLGPKFHLLLLWSPVAENVMILLVQMIVMTVGNMAHYFIG